ncbi:MAG: tetrahydromethanopterin S-methyltransferase subunit A [Euryarchaeota archaeon]|nr:tetrahydromethanopterin S-methyltransferase subunit A [Euryarchaeota archaeon]
MADKKEPAEGWPLVNGDYLVGDPESPVAAVTLASHIEAIPVDAGAAIGGPCKTENLGIEKVMSNTMSNSNIRFLILCGSEVQGHIVGQTMKALHANGIDPEKKRIIDADGAIPYIENVPMEGVERYQQQFEIIDMIDVEDAASIQSKVKECIEKDPGAFEEDPMIVEIEEKGAEDEGEEMRVVAPETALIEAKIRDIQLQIKSIGANQRFSAGMYAGKVHGIVIGLIFSLTAIFLIKYGIALMNLRLAF